MMLPFSIFGDSRRFILVRTLCQVDSRVCQPFDRILTKRCIVVISKDTQEDMFATLELFVILFKD